MSSGVFKLSKPQNSNGLSTYPTNCTRYSTMDNELKKEDGNSSDILNSEFYSSNSIDNLDHARNFRNSVLFRETSSEAIADPDLSIPQGNTNLTNNNDNDSLEKSLPLDDDEEEETQTQTIQMTTSPSLSALAGILNEKLKKAEQVRRTSMCLEDSIEEGEEDEEENEKEKEHDLRARKAVLPSNPSEEASDLSISPDLRGHHLQNAATPNLINVDDSDEFEFNQPLSVLPNDFTDQPDFLSTPKVEPPTPQVDPIPSYSSLLAQEDEDLKTQLFHPNSKKAYTNSQDNLNPSRPDDNLAPTNNQDNPKKPRAPSGEDPAIPATLKKQPQPQTNTPVSTQKKRKGIFSFLKKKPQRSNSFGEKPKKHVQSLPASSTFSAISSGINDGTPTKLTKKSHSSGSIFSNFRKAKAPKQETTVQPPKLSKTRNSISSQNTRSTCDSPIRTDINKRKPTPLNFEHHAKSTDADIKPEIETDCQEQLGEHPRVDSGEAVFPKSLNPVEVESIVSLERSRSLKSNQRNSFSSNRRSLTDNISINAYNEGMFVTEASSVVKSTPDLTKSPTNSILRTGGFDSGDLSPKKLFVTEEFTGLGISTSEQKSPQKDFSFSSIEKRLNELAMDSEHEEQQNDKKHNSTVSISDIDDTEFMSDIMEFASIIDFGDEINFDLDLNSDETKYQTLNPSRERSQYPLLKPGVNTSDSYSFQADHEQDEDSFERSDEPHMISRGGIGIQNARRDLNPENNNSEDDGFENEDFNQLEESFAESPLQSAYIPGAQAAVNRPISMSFRGLRAPQFNSTTDISALSRASPQTNITSSTSVRGTKRVVEFSSRIILYDTYSEYEYDRHPDIATCNQLTPQLAQMIKDELNELKNEMEIHEDSKCYTHFF